MDGDCTSDRVQGGPNANTRPYGPEISASLPFRRIPGKFRPGIPPGESCMAEKQWMTYSQIAERLGVTPDAIRHRSRKEKGAIRERSGGTPPPDRSTTTTCLENK